MPQHTAHRRDATRRDATRDEKHRQYMLTFVLYQQITAFGLAVFPPNRLQASHSTSPGLRLAFGLVFESGCNPSWSLSVVSCTLCTIEDTICVSCACFVTRAVNTNYLRYVGYVLFVTEREDYFCLYFLNILMIFQRECNRVLVPTPGWIEQNHIYQSTQNPA